MGCSYREASNPELADLQWHGVRRLSGRSISAWMFWRQYDEGFCSKIVNRVAE
jgi:hypothetical protein